jgi:hypothetical protein
MTAFTSRTLARHASLWDLAAIWVTLTATLAYLEVPLVNAPLFATALVLQAALGTTMITWLLNGVKPSLLLVLGPGLILGGALSFALFQLVGRGVVGVVASTLAGLGSAGLLVRSLAPETNAEPRWWLLGQVTGMGALALVPEFEELFPVAVVLFALGLVRDPARERSRWQLALAALFGTILIISTLAFRRDYWWLVTDDYLMLEVIARHLSIEGPFQSWGANSFTSYHWLSYGWSGLLDLLGGRPEPLVTLTRVMPIVYSVSMASSIVMIGKRTRVELMTMASMILAWAVISIGRFEWTGTSTGGVYAILAASVAVVLATQLAGLSKARILALLVMFFVLAGLTKLPSTFAFTLGVLIMVIEVALVRSSASSPRWVTYALSMAIAGLAILCAVWLFGVYVDGRIRFADMNPGLGQLASYGRFFVAPTLILNQLWIWILVGLAIFQRSTAREVSSWRTRWLLGTGAVSVACALVLEMSLSGSSNTYSYFSGPFYFLASLSILSFRTPPNIERVSRPAVLIPTAALVLAGVAWGASESTSAFWNLIGRAMKIDDPTKLELLKFFTSDRRVAVSFGAVIFLFVTIFFRSAKSRVVEPIVIALTVTTLLGLAPVSRESYDKEISTEQIVAGLGSESVREIGEWIRVRTPAESLIGTNYLSDESGGSVSEYAFAVWSQREFLVLGPQLGYGTSLARTAAFALSRSFADAPTPESCARLTDQGVKYFIADTQRTKNRDWSTCAEQVLSVDNFVVLELNERS